MKGLFLIPTLILCVSCNGNPDPKVTANQFHLGSDYRLHCPKCSSGPSHINFTKASDPDVGDGANNWDHQSVICGMCGFRGWATNEDVKVAVETQNGQH
jgi:hypothetical protein